MGQPAQHHTIGSLPQAGQGRFCSTGCSTSRLACIVGCSSRGAAPGLNWRSPSVSRKTCGHKRGSMFFGRSLRTRTRQESSCIPCTQEARPRAVTARARPAAQALGQPCLPVAGQCVQAGTQAARQPPAQQAHAAEQGVQALGSWVGCWRAAQMRAQACHRLQAAAAHRQACSGLPHRMSSPPTPEQGCCLVAPLGMSSRLGMGMPGLTCMQSHAGASTLVHTPCQCLQVRSSGRSMQTALARAPPAITHL